MLEEDGHDQDADEDDDDGCVQTHFGSGWGAGGLRGAMMTTLLRRHPEQYLQKNRFKLDLQYFRVVGPCYTYSPPTYFWTWRTRPWDFGELSAKIRTWAGGRLFRG